MKRVKQNERKKLKPAQKKFLLLKKESTDESSHGKKNL
jgi:hypothetical protein